MKKIILISILVIISFGGCSSYQENLKSQNDMIKLHETNYIFLGQIVDYTDFNMPLVSNLTISKLNINGEAIVIRNKTIIAKNDNIVVVLARATSGDGEDIILNYAVNTKSRKIISFNMKQENSNELTTKTFIPMLRQSLKDQLNMPTKIKTGTVLRRRIFGIEIDEIVKGWGYYRNKKIIVTEINAMARIKGKELLMRGYALYNPKSFIAEYSKIWGSLGDIKITEESSCKLISDTKF